MKRSRNLLALGVLTAVALGALTACQPSASPPATSQPAAQQQAPSSAFPSRAIDLVVCYSPGGGSGITAETMNKIIIDNKLSPQPFTIAYKPGATGQIGWAYVAGRKGDSHTIATMTTTTFVTAFLGESGLKMEQFTPIGVMAWDEMLMVTHLNSPLKTPQDVIDAAKKNPGTVTVATVGAGGSDANILGLIEMKVPGVKFNAIPFNSGAEVNAAILGGQVDLAISNPNELLPNIEAGKLRPITVFSDKRMSAIKDVPTMKESGYDVGFTIGRGVVAPAGIPAADAKWLEDTMRKVTASPAWKEYADKNMMTVEFLDSAQTGKYLADLQPTLTDVLTHIGVIKKK